MARQRRAQKECFRLLKILVKFPQLTDEELSDLTEQPLKTVQLIQQKISNKDIAALSDYLQEELLGGIPLKDDEVEQLKSLSEQLVANL